MATNPTDLMQPTLEPTGFEGLVAQDNQAEASPMEQGLTDLYKQQNSLYSEQKKALTTTTLLTALAKTDPSKPIGIQLTEGAIADARNTLEMGQERQVRADLVLERTKGQLAGLNTLSNDPLFKQDTDAISKITGAYNDVLKFDYEKKQKAAIEEAAIDRIRTMAVSDPVQAKVLLDNMEFGNADQSVRDFSVKLSILRQRAEELDDEYQQSGWGRFVLNGVLGLIPVNFNFQKTGVIGSAGIGDLFAVGNSIQRQSQDMWNMNVDDFAEFWDKNGAGMASIRDNATSAFDLISDPGAAVSMMEDLTVQGSSDRTWNNVWGGVEIASALPWTKIAKVTRLLSVAGDTKSAVRNLGNALDVLDTRGPQAMEAATGVTERELAEELSVSAVKGVQDRVPLSEPLAAHREAAQRVADELLNSPDFAKFMSMDELQGYVLGRIEEVKKIVGSPIKDVHMERIENVGGQSTHQLKFTIGKKDGLGYATEPAALRGLRQTGFTGKTFEESVARTAPKYVPESKLTMHGSTTEAQSGLTSHTFTVETKAGDEIKGSLTVDKEGVGKLDVSGMAVNELGPKEVRALTAKLTDEVPNLKKLEGIRSTGASADTEAAATSLNVEKLRGATTTFRDMSGQWFSEITVDMPEAGWLTGKLEPGQQGFVGKMVGRWFSPASRNSDSTLHGMSVQVGSYLNRAGKHIDNEVLGVFRGLGKQSKDIVTSLGQLSAIKSRWFKPEEVHFLVERQWGRRATDVEQKAYADLRLFNDMDHELRNTALYLDGLAKNKSSAKFTAKWGQEFDEDVIIDHGMTTVPSDRVYDVSRNKHYVHNRNPLTTEDLKVMKNNGYVMVRMPDGFSLPEGVEVNNLLIKKTDIEISPLRKEQLAYAEGGHRMYTSRYFVKQGRKGVQKDTGSEYLKSPGTHRTAENMAEGSRWAEPMNKARLAVKENRGVTAQEIEDDIFKNEKGLPTGQEFLDGVTDGTFDLEHPFETVFDRDMPSLYNQSGEDIVRLFDENELGINGYYRTTGRMYTSSKGEALLDTNGELADVLDPFDTLSKSLSQVTRQIGLHAYKMNAIERFENTYKNWLQVDPTLRSPSQVLAEAKVIRAASIPLRNQIEAQRAAIKNVLRFETESERLAGNVYQTLAESVLGDGSSEARKMAHDAIWWWKDNNPVSALRGLAFDMKLGMFNPGQLLVQASTMFSATALSPKFGMHGMSGLLPMHAYILKRGSENVLDTMVKRGVWKGMGFETADEFKEYSRHMFKNGFLEMNGNHIMINNYGPKAHFGSFGEKQARARDHARVFFYTAETWNRLVAYRIAWGETKKAGLTQLHPQFDANVLKLADDYSFNMTHESAAFWQKGLLSLPTQFWAYNARMIEAMFGKRFTAAQRTRLIGMNFAMAGTAGIPGLSGLAEYIKQKNGHSPPIDSLMGLADRGVIDYLNYQMTGADVIIGERIGTGGWATDVAKNMFGASEYGDKSLAEMAGGATYSITKNTSTTLWHLGKYALAESGSQMADGSITKENLIRLLNDVSTFGNINKAMMVQQYGIWKSNKGSILASDLPETQAIYAALSFRPAKADEIGYMLAWSKDRKEATQEISTQLANWRQEALSTGEWEKYQTKANILIQLVPQQDRRDVLRQANKRSEDASFYDHLERKVSEEQTAEETAKGLE